MDWKEQLIGSITDVDQRIFIKFCTLLGYSAKVTEDHLKKAIGERAYPIKSIERWQTRFRKGNTMVDDLRPPNIIKKNYIQNIGTSKNKTKEKQDKYLNNFLYSDVLDGGKKTFKKGYPNIISKSYIEKNYVTILNKALNDDKWVINETSFELILIHSYQSESSENFWRYAYECIYKKIDDKIDIHNICWKFLFLLHWLLRNGHPNVIIDSYRQRPLLVELGKIKKCTISQCKFVQLNPLYFALLFQKIEFHMEHTKIPGNLIVNDLLLEQFGSGDDFDIYDQLCIELFDYMDKILNFQSEILNIRGLSSMESYHKCILNPLKLCIIESGQIYDIIFQIMRKLHSNMPESDLAKHRNRFDNQFRQLKLFYRKCKEYVHLTESIQIPELIDDPPDFTKNNDELKMAMDDDFMEGMIFPQVIIDEL